MQVKAALEHAARVMAVQILKYKYLSVCIRISVPQKNLAREYSFLDSFHV